MGDSIADGLLTNDVLNPSSVVSNLGVQVSDVGIEVEIERLVELNPRIVFLSYGANDILIGHVTSYRFIQAYSELIDGIVSVLPDTTIIINGILPFRYDVVGSAIAEGFNEVLFDLAYSRQIPFLNHSELVREDWYEADGIHFTPEFYERWAEGMREAIEL
jgi:lysophospholipase L1-like esterase